MRYSVAMCSSRMGLCAMICVKELENEGCNNAFSKATGVRDVFRCRMSRVLDARSVFSNLYVDETEPMSVNRVSTESNITSNSPDFSIFYPQYDIQVLKARRRTLNSSDDFARVRLRTVGTSTEVVHGDPLMVVE